MNEFLGLAMLCQAMKLDVRGLEGCPAREDDQSVFRRRATDGDLS